MKPSVIERAYQLASSGGCKSLNEIERKLQLEKYEFVYIHMRGLGLRRDLRKLIRGCPNKQFDALK